MIRHAGTLTMLFATLGLALPVFAQQGQRYQPQQQGQNQQWQTWTDADELSDVEWERGEGYHEEEWYDPSDWFDTDAGIEYENDDWGGYGAESGEFTDIYGYDYYGGDYATDEYGYYDENYNWETDEGWFEGWFNESDELY